MNENLKNGITVKVKPSVAILTEFMRNGWSQNQLDMMLNPSRLDKDEYEFNPLGNYIDGKGYNFEWGHVLEVIDASDFEDDGKIGHSYTAQWEFSLDYILSLAHQQGWVLEDLCRSCEICFDQMKFDSPFSMDDWSSSSCFTFFIFTTDEKQFKEATKNTRRWLAEVFVPEHLPVLIKLLTKELKRNVPGQETKMQ